MANVITKAVWLTAEQCLPGGWFSLHEPAPAPDEAGLFRMQQGQEVGALARQLYANGVLVFTNDGRTAVELTQELIADASTAVLFEASFRSGSFVAKADILGHQNGAWHVLEVKASFSNTSKIDELVDDLAYTVWVLRRAGLSVGQASLMLLSRDFRFGDEPSRLFETIDKTAEVGSRVDQFEKDAATILPALMGDTPPAATLTSACRSCARFGDTCLRTRAEHTVLEIPSLHHTKLKKLSAAGILDLADVPDSLKLNERQERARNSALSGNMIIEPGLATALDAFVWPCHYLDFETVATVLPLYSGHGCHRQVLSQFSVHHRDAIDTETTHGEYLADAARDCERDLAEALIAQLGDRGSVVVYSSFEQTRIRALRDAFPDLAGPLDAILARLKDLLPIIEDNIYHPEFKGSFSIKHVLPALVPDLTYEGLDVRNGDMAITRFARMARGETTGTAVELTRRQLLEYCKMDTYAMVALHEVLQQFAAARRRAGG